MPTENDDDKLNETCGICGAAVRNNDELQQMECAANDGHFASYCDCEWVDVQPTLDLSGVVGDELKDKLIAIAHRNNWNVA